LTAHHRRQSLGCGCSSVVEHDLAKVGVEGSNPFARSRKLSSQSFFGGYAFQGNKTTPPGVTKIAKCRFRGNARLSPAVTTPLFPTLQNDIARLPVYTGLRIFTLGTRSPASRQHALNRTHHRG
jgi:hypothetical protein